MKSSLGGVTIGSVYYRTVEDQNTAGDIIERNTYIKVQNITYTYSRYYAFLTIIEDAAGIISVCQGYVEAENYYLILVLLRLIEFLYLYVKEL